jgi:cytochrome P450
MLLFTAGADTTGTTMGAMMNYMLGSPIVYGKMLAEIDSAFERGVLSKPIPTSIEVSKNCPYYVACVKESLRLCPSAPNIFPRLVQADHAPLVIDGKTIPVGTEITSTAYMANRDPELYGEDANEFRPDRWLEEDGEKGKLFDKYLATFGFGTRGCLGKELAMMELMKTPLMVSSLSLLLRFRQQLITIWNSSSAILSQDCASLVKRHQPRSVFLLVQCSIGMMSGSRSERGKELLSSHEAKYEDKKCLDE